ncbi:hypothetical protein Pelo_7394 [Pelomyxa schiedti]|nr:hypothetical protein Pelo_7394 [Pelomyxa schiedti]
MCCAMGVAEVPAKYWCQDCTRTSGGGASLFFCDACWRKAHWTPLLMSHAKLDPVSAMVPSPVSNMKACGIHHLPLDVFCETDGDFICAICSFSSHKGHSVGTVEDFYMKRKPSAQTFLDQLSQMEVTLDTLVAAIKLESVSMNQVHSQFEGDVRKEFSVLISRLQERQEELISTSQSISCSKACALSRQLECVSAGLSHIAEYKSKCESVLRSDDPYQIIELYDSIPGILRVLPSNTGQSSQLECECEPNHLSPCAKTGMLRCSTGDTEMFKSKIPQMCNISYVPVITAITEEAIASTTGGAVVKLSGCWPTTAINKDIQVLLGESVCPNVSVKTPGSVLTFTVPEGVGCDLPVYLRVFGVTADRPNDTRFSYEGPKIQGMSKVAHPGTPVRIEGTGFGTLPSAISISIFSHGVTCSNIAVVHPHTSITCTVQGQDRKLLSAPLTLTVGRQHTTSTVHFGMEWDTQNCGNLLVISGDRKTVCKPDKAGFGFLQSAVTALAPLIGDQVFEWRLSISGLQNPYGSQLVFFGVIAKPFDQNQSQGYCQMYGWSTLGEKMPTGGLAIIDHKAVLKAEKVTLRYVPSTLTLTATWHLHENKTTVLTKVPRGLFPVVIAADGGNTIKIKL